MTFGKKLCSIARDVSFEEEIWEKMRAYLIQIASNGHPKGCHVKLTGDKQYYKDALISIMKEEGIFYTDIGGTNETDIGLIYWGEKEEKFDKVSDSILTVCPFSKANIYCETTKLSTAWLKRYIDFEKISYIK